MVVHVKGHGSLAGERKGHALVVGDADAALRCGHVKGHNDFRQHRDLPPVCILDELHKHGRWKALLKGLFDTYGHQARFLVTGSARLDVFRAGADSLMGRYFGYRMHPLSVAELISPAFGDTLIRPPQTMDPDDFDTLVRLGGYPEPFLKGTDRFWRRWTRTRARQLLREDLRDLTQVRELGQVETVAELLRQQVGQLTSYSSISRAVGASVDSVKRWIKILESLYVVFSDVE